MAEPHEKIRQAAMRLIGGQSIADRIYRRLVVLLAIEANGAASDEAVALAKILTRDGNDADVGRVLRQAAHAAEGLLVAAQTNRETTDGAS